MLVRKFCYWVKTSLCFVIRLVTVLLTSTQVLGMLVSKSVYVSVFLLTVLHLGSQKRQVNDTGSAKPVLTVFFCWKIIMKDHNSNLIEIKFEQYCPIIISSLTAFCKALRFCIRMQWQELRF